MSKGGQKTKSTQTQGLTGNSLGMQNDIYGTARRAASGYTSVGVDPNSTEAAGAYTGFIGAGRNGLAALGGDPAAMGKLMNPYQDQVVSALNDQYGRDQSAVTAHTNDVATKAGAFGGSRHGVAEGIAQGQLSNNHMGQVAGVLQDGYNNAQGVAGQLASMGLSGANGAAGMGEYMRNVAQENANPEAARLGLLTSGMAGGGTASGQQTQTTQQPGSSFLQNLGGVASLGAGIFGGPLGKFASGLFNRNKGPQVSTTPAYGPTGYEKPMSLLH